MTEQASPQERRVRSLLLPFPGSKGTTIIKNINKTLKNVLPTNLKTRISYTGQKLYTRFQIKDINTILFIIQNPLNHPVRKTISVKQVEGL